MMSLVFATTGFFGGFFFLGGGGGVLRHSAVQTDFEFEISGSLVVVIPGHNLGNSQLSVNRTIGPTLVYITFNIKKTSNTSKTYKRTCPIDKDGQVHAAHSSEE